MGSYENRVDRVQTAADQNLLDNIRQVEAPEGIELQLKVAGPVSRAAAFMIDLVIRAGIYLLVAVIAGLSGNLGTAFMFVMVFLLEWFYPVVFELVLGATPGKRVMGLLVLHDDATPIDWSASLLRNLLRAADFFPICYCVGLISMMTNRDFKRLGDFAAGTVVVYQDGTKANRALPEQTPISPPCSLKLNEQRAIIDFAERSGEFSTARQEELALILEPLHGSRSQESVRKLWGYANWLLRGGG